MQIRHSTTMFSAEKHSEIWLYSVQFILIIIFIRIFCTFFGAGDLAARLIKILVNSI